MTCRHIGIALFAAAAWFATACGVESGSPATTREIRQAIIAAPSVRISELHYDNLGTDTGEAIELSGPAGSDVTGWSVVLYNGNGGAPYQTQILSGTIPTTCGDRGVLVLPYATNGIQNGGTTATGTESPDAVALVDASGAVIEFLSYEGVFAAASGPALGLTSTDIGVRELGSEPAGLSLQRTAAAAWTGPVTATFGACNDDDSGAPPPPDVASVAVSPAVATIPVGATQAFVATALDAANQPISGVVFTWSTSAAGVTTISAVGTATAIAPGDAVVTATAPGGVAGVAALHVDAATRPALPDTRFSELHYDNTGSDVGEAIEIAGPAGGDLTGWSVVLYDGNGGAAYSTTALTGTIPATCAERGVVVVNYPSNGIQNGSPDGMALVDPTGHVVEFLSYEGTMTATTGPAAGMTSIDIVASEVSSSPIGSSLQRDSFDRWTLANATFGACNVDGPPPARSISFTGRAASDPALPVGFQAQLFATELDASNAAIPTAFTWSSDTPSIAAIDQSGVMTGLAEGTAILRATAADGITASYPLPVHIAVASTTAVYQGNAEFGEPSDADPSDDYVVRRAQYTLSYNHLRGEPNWVAYDINATAFGAEDRCNCFTFDPALPASFPHLTTADYTGAGAAAGFGIDRGHLARSADRTSASLDNSVTFYLSNVVPQTADLNQGPWAALETFLADRARLEDKEVRVVTGPAGNQGTIKGEGKIVIPETTWKVAVIMPRGKGLADLRDYRDLEVIAVDMPNVPGIRTVAWQTYLTTVDAIEARTGYDLLALLPDKIQDIVEAGIQPPIAAADGPYAGAEGSAITMRAAGSLDPNGSVTGYTWIFDDGTRATGPEVNHAFTQDGVHAIQLVVTDDDGLTDTLTTTATIGNVPPRIAALAGAMLLPGEVYAAAGSFDDPGSDPWAATVDYGDGTGPQPLALAGTAFTLSHRYIAAGTYAVTVAVSDDHDTATASATVVVQRQSEALGAAFVQIDQLAATGELTAPLAGALRLAIHGAIAAYDASLPAAAIAALQLAVIELDLLVWLRRLPAADAAPLRALLTRVIRATPAHG